MDTLRRKSVRFTKDHHDGGSVHKRKFEDDFVLPGILRNDIKPDLKKNEKTANVVHNRRNVRKNPVKDVQRKDVDRKDVDRKDVERKDVERKDVERKDVERKDVERKDVDRNEESDYDSAEEETCTKPKKICKTKETDGGTGLNQTRPPLSLFVEDVPQEGFSEHVPFEIEDAYRIMTSKILRDGFAKHHTESFSDFMHVKIPGCLSEHPPIIVVHEQTDTEHVVEIQSVRFDRPSVKEANGVHRYITPHECHIRRLTYNCNMIITARFLIRKRSSGQVLHSVVFRDKVFDKIPCMKKSEFCVSSVDPENLMEDEAECGGYFISTGAEKVIIGQEGPRTNYPFVTEESNGNFKCECRSFNEIKYRSTSTLYIELAPPFVTKNYEERRISVVRITVRIPFVSDPLRLPVTFKLLGITDIEEMIKYICVADDPDWFRARVLDALLHDMDAVVMTQEYAVINLAHDRGQAFGPAKKRKEGQEETQAAKRRRKRFENETEYERCQKQVTGLISTEFFPHQGYMPENVGAKIVLLGIAVRKLMRVFYGLQEVDDRDHYMHRRVQLPSTLLCLLFRQHWTMWRRRMAAHIRRDLDNGSQFVNIKELLRATIGSHLQTALSTGNFSMQRGQNNMDGVGQVLSRTEPYAAVSHVNRMSNPMNKDGRAINPRLQNESCMGIIDPWETPEGQSCGLMRNMAPMAGIRVGYPNETLIAAVISTGMIDEDAKNLPLSEQTNCQVYVNGTLIGVCAVPDSNVLLELLRAQRATQDIPFDVSIYKTAGTWSTVTAGEIHINGDPGSYWWPLIRVDRMHRMRYVLDTVTNEDELWTILLSEGIVEVINKDEEVSSVRVALSHQQLAHSVPGTYTHVVIHSSQICSVFTARGPLLEFEQAPRVTYQAAMGKQAIGRAMSNSKYRADTASHTLWYTQRALVGTFMDDALSPDGVISGMNPVVAILAKGSFNIEDSLIFNAASIQRGLFRSDVTKTTRDVVRTSDNEIEELRLPPEECRSKLYANYSKINPETGTVDPGIQLDKDDVIISKIVRLPQKRKITKKNGEVEEIDEEVVRDRSTTVKTRESSVVDDVIMSTTLEGEQTIRVKTRSTRIPEVGDKLACLTGDHDVLTASRGWVKIADITTDDFVACLDRATMGVTYIQPTKVHMFEDNTEVVELHKPDDFIQTVTLNHRLPLYTTGIDGKKGIYLVCADSAIYEHIEFKVLNNAPNGYPGTQMRLPPYVDVAAFMHSTSPTVRANWMYVLGYIHAFGSTHAVRAEVEEGSPEDPVQPIDELSCDKKRRREDQVIVIISQPHLTHSLKVRLKDLGIEFVQNWSTLQIKHPENKHMRFVLQEMPAWVLHLNANDALMFLRGFSGVPEEMQRHAHIFRPKNEEQTDRIMQVAVHAGVRARHYPATLASSSVIRLNLFSHQNTTQSTSNLTADHVHVRACTDKVYCITVPGSEIFCVRKQGFISWTGNSRYGQKGTIGALYDTIDMPYNPITGIVPDLLVNPHAIPSRMTIGHMLETLMGKVAALYGELADGTPFVVSEKYQYPSTPGTEMDHNEIIHEIGKRLKEFGFTENGNEMLIDGRTGEKLKMTVFMGPMTYVKLKHMVQDKYHARSRGPVQMQTKQPLEGRQHEGGQRFGEMERDNLIGHGATALLQERLLFSSDKASVPVCTECGKIAQPAKKHHGNALFSAYANADKAFCQTCLRHDTVQNCEMPYAYKLSVQELEGLMIASEFKFADEDDIDV